MISLKNKIPENFISKSTKNNGCFAIFHGYVYIIIFLKKKNKHQIAYISHNVGNFLET